MNSGNIQAQIQEILETIQEQTEALLSEKPPVPQIEFDLLKANVQRFYDLVHMLQRLNDPYDRKTAARPEIKSVNIPEPPAGRKDKKEKPQPAGTEMDLFAGEEPEFNIRLKEAREKSLPAMPDPGKHLKELVSINDKFIFINELFDGNLKEYNETVEELNGFREKAEAMDHLDQLRKKNLWELGSGTFMKLKEIVEKKFPS